MPEFAQNTAAFEVTVTFAGGASITSLFAKCDGGDLSQGVTAQYDGGMARRVQVPASQFEYSDLTLTRPYVATRDPSEAKQLAGGARDSTADVSVQGLDGKKSPVGDPWVWRECVVKSIMAPKADASSTTGLAEFSITLSPGYMDGEPE